MKCSEQWQEELNKTGLSTEKKKVGMLCKSVCVYYLCNSSIVLKAESPVCHAALKFLFYFIVFWLWPAFACCVGSSWAWSSFLHSQQQASCGEGWNLNILPCHTLLFRKKVAPPPDPRLQPESCLLLQPTPTRGGQKARVSSRTNTYILVDSGLRVRISSDAKLCNQNFFKEYSKEGILDILC